MMKFHFLWIICIKLKSSLKELSLAIYNKNKFIADVEDKILKNPSGINAEKLVL